MSAPHDPNVTADLPSARSNSLCAADPLGTSDHARGSASTDESRPAADAPARDLPAIPGYRVVREIAHGGMGRVLAAFDLSLDRDVALKILLPGADADRFVRESKITARLPHPGIPPVYALGTLTDGSPFLAMKLIAGQTLTEEMKTADRPRLLQAFAQVCQAVGFAHSRSIIHRDLKPANVMVGAFGEVQVMDWGLAKDLAGRDIADEPRSAKTRLAPLVGTDVNQTTDHRAPGESTDEQTRAGTVMGTPSYMAPEQARGEATDARADVFALGGILCVILTGQPPFVGKSSLEMIRRAAGADMADVFARLDSCGADPELVALCKVCLSPDSADRPANGQAAADAVAAYQAGVEHRLRQAEREWAAAEVKVAEQRKRRRVQLALGAAVLLLVLGGGAFAWWQDRLAGERRIEQTRNGQQIDALLDRCATAIQEDDTAGAQLAVGEAEKRAKNLGAEHQMERLVHCRSGADVLAELDRIDALRWDAEGGPSQGPARAVRAWPGAFATIGVVVVGQKTPAAQAAEAVNGSLARDRLLAALDLWLVFAAQADQADLAAVLAAADADRYRDAVRAAMQRSDWQAVGALAAKDEAFRQPARFAAALGSIAAVPPDQRLAVLGAAARARPRDFGVLMTAGYLFRPNDAGTAAKRIAWFRGAVIVRPTSANAHNDLGIALSDEGDKSGGEAEYREAIRLAPKYAPPHNNLGNALRDRGDIDGAVTAYQEAIRLDPKFTKAHNNLGVALERNGDLDGALAAYQASIHLDRQYAWPHNNLGNVLQRKGNLEGAVAEFKEAIRLDPKLARPHNNLGWLLQQKGDLDGAISEFKGALLLDPKYAIARVNLSRAERMRDLLRRLPEVLADRAKPKTPAEACEFAYLCGQPFQKRYAASVRLYEKAFAADARLATAHQYNAACSAVRVARGDDDDAPADAAERTALRAKAVNWLRADLALRRKQLESDKFADRTAAQGALRHLQQDTDLSGVHDAAALASLPAEEQKAFTQLWADVAALLRKAEATSSKSVR